MTDFGAAKFRNEILLVARLLLVALFLIFGWSKLTNYAGTVAYMQQSGTPIPPVSALIAIFVEFFLSVALVAGVLTRPLSILLAIYTLATAFIGHHYWTMTGAAQYGNMINFYKNVSIMGGFLALYVTGAGRYSVDAKLGAA